MAPNQSKPVHGDSSARRKRIIAPITLACPEKPELVKGQYITLKLRSNPAEPGSPTYDLPLPYFVQGTPEEWLRFMRNLKKAIAGQNVTTGPTKYTLCKRVLEGDALAAFNSAAELRGNETNEHFEECLADVTAHVFPARALQSQKRYMRRFLQKPADVSIREHVARVVEINKLLPEFPPIREDDESTSLPDDELLDLLEFGIPNSWQKTMMVQDFDPVDHTISEFIRFCERLENTEDKPSTQPIKRKEHTISPNKSQKRPRPEHSSKPAGRGKNCLLHGDDCGHGSDKCFALKAQAKRMKGTYDAQHPSKKKEYKKTQELNSIVLHAVEQALKTKKKPAQPVAKKARRHVKESDDSQENYNFDKLEPLEDTDSDSS